MSRRLFGHIFFGHVSRRFAALANVCLPLRALFLCLLGLGAVAAPARAQSASDPVYVFHTNLGDISVQLYPDVAPQTVANFLHYVNVGAYNNSLIHRSVPGFIFQGGDYQVQSGPSLTAVSTAPPVPNEFNISNTRGTIAMAKRPSDPNSATSQWFFNESDSNAANLDNQNGGFTVFGKVTDTASLAVMDAIAAVPVPNPPPFNPPLDQLPLINYQPANGLQTSNLVIVSSITTAGHTHLLWTNTNGTASIWDYDPAATAFTQNSYGPFPGWTAKAIASGGTDGLTRVLWDNADGTASIWSLDNTSAVYTHHEFGPYPGWTATALSVAADGTTHLLWVKTDGTASLWNYSTASGTFTQNAYGPFPGWTARAIADGPDGKMRVLWNNTSGQASIWSLDNVAALYTHGEFGPYPGWSANAVSVGADGTTHLLWDNADGHLSLWNYSTASGAFTQTTYGPFGGWAAAGIADGPDGRTRVLWDNTSGQSSIWSLDNVAALYTHGEFGPYSGWTAVGVSAGP